VSKRATASEPAFGTDSFLDVTANLVGVLIVFIVLVGMRVSKITLNPGAIDAEIQRRLGALQAGNNDLTINRRALDSELQELRRGVTAKQNALVDLRSRRSAFDDEQHAIQSDVQTELAGLRERDLELAGAEAQLVSLSNEYAALKVVPTAKQELVHRSPIAQAVESDEIHLELGAGIVTFVDLEELLERVRIKCRLMEAEIRARGRVTDETGAVGPFRLRFTLAREEIPFSQSMFYTSNSFHVKLVDWQVIPTEDARGELVNDAIQPNSQLNRVLARRAPNKYAVTVWTYTDSFSAFRTLRDALTERGYVVAARPLPPGIGIRGSVLGSRSAGQ
jgi:hypothetical protein